MEPFKIIMQDDKYHICLGNQKVSNYEFDNSEDAISYLEGRDWQLILNCCAVIIHNALLYNNLIKNNNENDIK